MKTRTVPAQITTVEDKIAGSLNFTQILLLIASLLTSTSVYVTFPETMKFTAYKIPLIITIFVVFGTLAIRFKDRVVISWLALFVVYGLRPHLYVFKKKLK